MTVDDLADYLRYRVVGLLHVGRTAPGGRLPSIRQLSRALDADHRAVAAAYRRLEDEGLVEVRPGSGVYAAGEERSGRGVASVTVRWAAGLFFDGWQRRMPRAQVGELVARCADARPTCACLESVVDHRVALSAELERDFDLVVDPVRVSNSGTLDDEGRRRLEAADLAVTLQFHAAGTPLVVVSINPELVREVEAVLHRGPVTAVVADRRMGTRAERYLGVTDHRDAVNVVLAEELESLEPLEAAGPVLATLAARRHLGAEEYHLVPPPPTFVAPASAREILEQVVRGALEEATPSG